MFMLEDRVTQVTIGISLIFHLAVLIPFSNLNIFEQSTPEDQLFDLMVSQYMETEIMEIPMADEPLEPDTSDESISETADQAPQEEAVSEFDLDEFLKKLEEEDKSFQKKLDEQMKEQERLNKMQEDALKNKDGGEKERKKKLIVDAKTLEQLIFSYTDLLRELIYQNIEFDPERFDAPEEGYVRVFFTLAGDGHLLSLIIPPSFRSSSEYLNSIAAEAVRKAALKFPPLPKNYGKESETFDIGIRVKLKEIKVE